MSSKVSKRVGFRPDPDVNEKLPPTLSLSFSTVGIILRRIGDRVGKALSCGRRSSCKVSSTSSLARSRSCHADQIIDSHRAEAVEDCIEFFNSSSSPSSSSLRKSFSVSAF